MARISKMTKALGQYRNFAAAVAIAMMTVFLVVQQSAAGPITGGMGSPPYSKLSVYQGVISIVPGGLNDHVMEIGNAGRDIASTGSIYLRPGTVNGGGGDVVITAQNTVSEGGELILAGAGSNPSWWLDAFGISFRIYDNAGIVRLAVANSGNVFVPSGKVCFSNTDTSDPSCVGKNILLTNQGDNAQSIGVSAGSGLPDTGAYSFAFLMPYASFNGAYSDVTRQNDSGLFFSRNTGLTISGWNPSGIIKGARFTGSGVANAALTVNNGLGGAGNSDDALAVYANSVNDNSAIYAEQSNPNGWAGYFSGKVNISGTLRIGGVDKDTLGIQVCPTKDHPLGVNSGCLGQYLYTGPIINSPTLPTADRGINGVTYYYWNATTRIIASVPVYNQFTSVGTICSSGYTKTTRCTSGASGDCRSYFSALGSGCTTNEGEYMHQTSTHPYGSGEVCVSNTSVVISVEEHKDPSTGGVCTAVSPPPTPMRPYYITGYRTRAVTPASTYYLPVYELR